MAGARGYIKTKISDAELALDDIVNAHPADAAEIIISELVGWHKAERIRSFFKIFMLLAVLGFLIFLTVEVHKNEERIEALNTHLGDIDTKLELIYQAVLVLPLTRDLEKITIGEAMADALADLAQINNEIDIVPCVDTDHYTVGCITYNNFLT